MEAVVSNTRFAIVVVWVVSPSIGMVIGELSSDVLIVVINLGGVISASFTMNARAGASLITVGVVVEVMVRTACGVTPDVVVCMMTGFKLMTLLSS